MRLILVRCPAAARVLMRIAKKESRTWWKVRGSTKKEFQARDSRSAACKAPNPPPNFVIVKYISDMLEEKGWRR